MGEGIHTAAEFEDLYHRLRDAAPWGPNDRRGALNYITPARLAAAASRVRVGRTVSMAARIEHEATADNPDPAVHEMIRAPTAALAAEPSGLNFALDHLSLNVHGNADSHIDALSHVVYDGALYNDVPPDQATTQLSIDSDEHGIAGRGVLLDIPRVRGVDWLEPGEHVTADDIMSAERAHRVQIGPGDLLFVRVGHRRRRNELGPWDAAESRAGLDPRALELLADRQISVLGSDSNNDTAPTAVTGVDFPVHALALRALGLMLLDYLQFEDLVHACIDADSWSFLCVIAPLRLPKGTGSPVNPIAIF